MSIESQTECALIVTLTKRNAKSFAVVIGYHRTCRFSRSDDGSCDGRVDIYPKVKEFFGRRLPPAEKAEESSVSQSCPRAAVHPDSPGRVTLIIQWSARVSLEFTFAQLTSAYSFYRIMTVLPRLITLQYARSQTTRQTLCDRHKKKCDVASCTRFARCKVCFLRRMVLKRNGTDGE
ncbi:hypothetical protein EVAR_34505_1 [Eumeta japonica]|uniref:Uncharacterized protein n=1 Tax=Eumeta variegata TaxID=151549 RepID=A0A4C1Z274_EUMVA|nr:hypothetical protein EVAR_34505_1 [Eumeta japonica]